MSRSITKDSFYADLHGFGHFSDFSAVTSYQPLPADWWIVITDVEGSTRAIEAGRYKDVNAVGAASIIALLNAVEPLRIPFQFGGDGSTFCIPSTQVEVVKSALVATRQMAKESFSLSLRIGMVSMRDILAQGGQVLVGKFYASPDYEQAMFMGNGLMMAESMVKAKGDNPYLIDPAGITPDASFEGFQCRWQEIPSSHEEVVAILVQVLGHDDAIKQQHNSQLFETFESIYGQAESHHPVRDDRMRLNHSLPGLAAEFGVQTAGMNQLQRWKYMLILKIRTTIASWLVKSSIGPVARWWARYKQHFIANTDHRKFDGALRMIVSGKTEQRHRFEQYLQQEHQTGRLVYGLHVSDASLATCLVRDYESSHIHFLDAADGGYALAARQLKTQLNACERQ